MFCYLYEQPTYLFFASDIPEILYYSHIPTTLLALFIGFFVFASNPRRRLNQLLLLITIAFAAWTTTSLFGWTNINGDLLAFMWPFYAISSTLLAVFCLYFALVFYKGSDVSFHTKLSLLALVVPVLLFSHTNLSLTGFDLTSCDAFAYDGVWFKKYYTLVGFISVVWIAVAGLLAYKKSKGERKKQILLMTVGIEIFLFLFLASTFIFSYLVNIGLLEDSRIEMYGLFGMVLFVGFISFMIVKFKTFNIKLAGAQVLMLALIALIGSQLFFANSVTGAILVLLTFLLSLLGGSLLISSIKKEMHDKEKLQLVTNKLEKANDRLRDLDKLKSEFVSIASHQLRSPITAIRGYVSLLREGSYGVVTEKMEEPLQRIEESSKRMAMTIEDYLNISLIESGNMKYDNSEMNLNEEVMHLCDDNRKGAYEKGLDLIYRSDLKSNGIIHADANKVSQIIQNLLNNSIKYTPEGRIKVLVRDDVVRNMIYVEIEDTGLGMSQITLDNLFQKFERSNNKETLKINGTGIGLFIAQKMAEAMNGKISADSEGENEGSRFTLEFPLSV